MSVERTDVAVLGGDLRQRYAAECLRRKGLLVRTWGLEDDGEAGDWRDLTGARCFLLPLPVTADGITIQTPLCRAISGLRFDALAPCLTSDAHLLGGAFPPAWLALAEARGLSVTDYAKDEVFGVRNALPTAEGAILLALEALPRTLCGTRVAVTGYGKIASLLADRLRALGANTVVLARKARDLACAPARGHETVRLCEGIPIKLPVDCRVLFNTVPYPIFGRDALRAFPRDCLYIELASLPGGVDRAAAGEFGIRILQGGGLPGRFFPESAGQAVAQAVLDACNIQTENGKE